MLDELMSDLRVALVLIFLGLVCLLAELFVPSGGVLGLLALGCSAFGIYSLFYQDHYILGALATVAVVAAFTAGLRFMVRRFGKGAVLPAETPEAPRLPPTALVGKEGVCHTALRPSGTAVFDGQKLDVVSDGRFIPGGTRVKIVELSENRVVVREVST